MPDLHVPCHGASIWSVEQGVQGRGLGDENAMPRLGTIERRDGQTGDHVLGDRVESRWQWSPGIERYPSMRLRVREHRLGKEQQHYIGHGEGGDRANERAANSGSHPVPTDQREDRIRLAHSGSSPAFSG